MYKRQVLKAQRAKQNSILIKPFASAGGLEKLREVLESWKVLLSV